MKLIEEPVEEWNNLNLLKLFYDQKDRWSFTFEHFVQLSRLRAHMASLNEARRYQNKIIILERSLWSSHHVFTKNTFEENGIKKFEYDILDSYYKVFSKQLLNDSESSMLPFKIIYLKTSPNVCYERLKGRSREAETNVSLSYLTKIHDKYEQWITSIVNKNPSLVSIIDGDEHKFTVAQEIENLVGTQRFESDEDENEVKIKLSLK